MQRLVIPFVFCALCSAVLATRAWAVLDLYVSPDGDDGWSGQTPAPNAERTDGPLATLEAARDAIRSLKGQGGLPEGGVTVHMAEGDYRRDGPFELRAADSGEEGAPIVYRADTGSKARLLGGALVSEFRPVSDPAVLGRLDESVRDAVVEVDLRRLGITDYGTLKPRGFGRGAKPAALELFYDGKPMTPARWPNDDWAHIASVPEGSEGVFQYEGDRPERWSDPADVWIHGYWTWDWADSFEKVQSLDTATKTLTTVPPHGAYGYKAGKRYYFLNVLEELDAPGEWYLDHDTGMLYFRPPGPLEEVETAVSLLETPMLVVEDVSWVTIHGLAFEYGRHGGAVVRGGHDTLIGGCTFANLGTFAVGVSGGERNGVAGCDAYHLGDSGISVSGGDRATLTPAGNYAVDNHIHDFGLTVRTYTPALSVSGVGNRIAHNLVHDAPHMAIGLGGNDHVIEFNEVHHVLMETHDAGAFYMGRDWTQRGNVVRHNYFHDMGHGDVQAIYLDDWTSGTTVYGNVCVGARRGVLVGGGRDNVIENNVFIDCTCAIHIDQRGLGWAKYYFDGTTTTLFDRLEAVNGTKPPYSERYPELATLLEDEPVLAKGNVIARNIRVGGGWLDLHNGLDESTPYLTIEGNFVEGDPGFVDPEGGDYRLRDDSPVFPLGFKRIPTSEIGLLRDRGPSGAASE